MISTSPSPSFVGRSVLMAVLCIGFSIWGAYDLWVTIPNRTAKADQYEQLATQMTTLESSIRTQTAGGRQAAPELVQEYQRVEGELTAIAPGGKVPSRPSKFDHVVQWIYISCFPLGIMPIISLIKLSKQRYRLEDDGSVHFAGDATLGSGHWPQADIADIDMHRWMAKSIPWLVHRDGQRLKFDAYHHKNLELIVGTIAHRLHPEAWQADARPVKAEETPPAAEADALADSENSPN